MTEYDVVIFIFQNFDISTYYGDFQIVMEFKYQTLSRFSFLLEGKYSFVL